MRFLRPTRARTLLASAGLGLLVATTALAATPAAPLDQEEVRRILLEEAQDSRVPPELALALAKVGSDFLSNALGQDGAIGVLQLTPLQARAEFGVEPVELWDPRRNARLGLDLLGRLHERLGTWELALAQYREGPTGPDLREVSAASRDFVDAVLRWRDRYAAQRMLWAGIGARESKALAAAAGRAEHRPTTGGSSPPPRRVHGPDAPFGPAMEAKLAWAQAVLDDFGPRRGRW